MFGLLAHGLAEMGGLLRVVQQWSHCAVCSLPELFLLTAGFQLSLGCEKSRVQFFLIWRQLAEHLYLGKRDFKLVCELSHNLGIFFLRVVEAKEI
jgi:hypothetical protein